MSEILPIVGPAYDSGIIQQNKQRLVNWYLEQDQFGGLQDLILRPTPGMKAFSSVGSTTVIRGLLDYRGVLYCVADHTLYTIASTGTETSRGSLNTADPATIAPIRMAAWGDQLLIIDGSSAYVYNITSTILGIITDPDFPSSPVDVTTHDGYFIVTESSSEKFYISTSADATGWNALDFAQSNTKGDYLLGCVSDHREIWLFGDKTTEVWFNSGNADFPFERRGGVLIPHGTASIRTVALGDNTIYWLGKDESGQNLVMRAEGYVAKSIASQAITREINSYTTVSDAHAYTHREGSHEFYVLTFPTENKTWVYDVSIQQWHERQSLDTGVYGRHRGNCHAFSSSKSLVGDSQSGNIFEYDEATYDENGSTLRRRRTTFPLEHRNMLTTIYNLQLEFEPGVGLQTGQGSDPQVMLKVSKDGGHTFGNELWRDIGKAGVYRDRVKWDSLGIGRDWIIDIQISDPINAVLLGATADLEKGA